MPGPEQVGTLFLIREGLTDPRHPDSSLRDLPSFVTFPNTLVDQRVGIHLDDSLKFPEAVQQARRVSQVLIGWDIEEIIMADSRSAGQMKKLVEDTLDFGYIPSLSTHYFRPRNFGIFTDATKSQLAKLIPDTHFQLRSDWNFSPPGGESMAEVCDRVMQGYRQLLAPRLSWGENVVLFTHQDPIRILMMQAEGLKEVQVMRREINPGDVYTLRVSRSGELLTPSVNEPPVAV